MMKDNNKYILKILSTKNSVISEIRAKKRYPVNPVKNKKIRNKAAKAP